MPLKKRNQTNPTPKLSYLEYTSFVLVFNFIPFKDIFTLFLSIDEL